MMMKSADDTSEVPGQGDGDGDGRPQAMRQHR
jgi:hypothetical protein